MAKLEKKTKMAKLEKKGKLENQKIKMAKSEKTHLTPEALKDLDVS